MPHDWNNMLVVTESELVPAFYKSGGHLRMEVSRYSEKEYGIKKVQRGCNSTLALFSYDSLPNEIKNAIPDPRKHNHLLEIFYEVDPAAVTFYTKHEYIDGAGISLPKQEEYITNASVLKACVALKAARVHERQTKGGSCKKIMQTLCEDAKTFNPCLHAKHGVQHTLPESERWFKEAFKSFLNEGKEGFDYASLISKKDRNQNAQKVTDDYINLLNELFAGTGKKPHRTEVARQYNAFLTGYVQVIKDDATGEMYDPQDFKPISPATIINYLGNWQEAIGNQAKRSGNRQKLMGLFKPYHSFEQPTFAGSLISVDDRQPPFQYAKGERPWFYNGIDLASEAFVCWVWGRSKKGIIVEFYQQLVRNYTEWGFNLPHELEGEMSLNSGFTNTFLRNGAMFQKVRLEANNARGKRIEAYYRQLRYAVEKVRDGWLARPFALSESNQPGKRPQSEWDDYNYVGPITPYNDIIEGCLKDIEDWNNMPHSKYPDKTRWEVFEEMQHPDLKPTNWRAILPFLGHRTPTTCGLNGILNLQKKEFLLGNDNTIATSDALIQLMMQVSGRQVDVYWLDGNNGQVLKALIFIGDVCICEAVPKPIYNRASIERTPKDEANCAIMSAYIDTIDAYQARKAASINQVLVIDNTEKTLNRKFVMPGISRFTTTASDGDTEVLPAMPDENDYLLPVQANGFVRSQKDRF